MDDVVHTGILNSQLQYYNTDKVDDASHTDVRTYVHKQKYGTTCMNVSNVFKDYYNNISRP